MNVAATAGHAGQVVETAIGIRAFEYALLDLYQEGLIGGTVHTSLGQEYIAACIAGVTRPEDTFVSNHRCHAHFLAATGNTTGLLDELLGLASGVSGGLGGSQHLFSRGRFYSSGIQGGIVPLATGLACAAKLRAAESIVVVFIGDGTLGEGVVYECWNIAAILGLPLLVVLEDNHIAQSTPSARAFRGSVAERAAGFGLAYTHRVHPGVAELLECAGEIVARVRSGTPALLHVECARLGPHSKGDDTRPRAELDQLWREDVLSCEGRPGRVDLESRVGAEKERILRLARERLRHAVEPAAPKEQLLEVDAGLICRLSSAVPDGSFNDTLVGLVNSALHDLAAGDSTVIVLGEDIADPYGGAFKATRGLSTRVPDQVFSSPISEAAIVGIAGGLALAGYKPVCELMFSDFLALAADQIVNHLTKYDLMYGQACSRGAIIRTPSGSGRGYGPTHSQTLEKLFFGTPNLSIFELNIFQDIRHVYACAAKCRGTVLMVEPKRSYASRLEDFAHYRELFAFDGVDGGHVRVTPRSVERSDVLLVTHGFLCETAIAAAAALALRHERMVSCLFLGRLSPLVIPGECFEGIRTIVVYVDHSPRFGLPSEIALQVLRSASTPVRIVPIEHKFPIVPASRLLEKQLIPHEDDLVRALAVADALLDTLAHE